MRLVRDVMDLPLRKRIFEFVRANPGIHFREVQRHLGLAVGQLDFHMNSMLKAEVLVKEEISGNARYYVRDRFTKEEKKALAMLRREIPRGIILFLLERPGSTPGAILENFSFTSATLSYHLKRLERIDVLQAETMGRERHYSVTDPDLMRSLLIMYRSTIFDGIIDTVS